MDSTVGFGVRNRLQQWTILDGNTEYNGTQSIQDLQSR